MPVLSPDVSYYLYSVRKGSEETDRELKQQRRRRLRETSLKKWIQKGFKLYCTYSISFNSLFKCWHFCLELNIEVQEKKNKVSAFSTKREIRHSQGVVVQWQQRHVQTSVMHVQICCFSNLTLLHFLPFSLPSPSSLLTLPNIYKRLGAIYPRHLSDNLSFSLPTMQMLHGHQFPKHVKIPLLIGQKISSDQSEMGNPITFDTGALPVFVWQLFLTAGKNNHLAKWRFKQLWKGEIPWQMNKSTFGLNFYWNI